MRRKKLIKGSRDPKKRNKRNTSKTKVPKLALNKNKRKKKRTRKETKRIFD